LGMGDGGWLMRSGRGWRVSMDRPRVGSVDEMPVYQVFHELAVELEMTTLWE